MLLDAIQHRADDALGSELTNRTSDERVWSGVRGDHE